jgi:nitric oxide dioxygenase
MPLTDEQKTIVKATIPILETGGEVLTKHFYGVMLSEFPEVVPFFNKTHQRSGDQPRALAHAVLMYAKHIDRLEAIGGLAAQIINKHVALAVRADHYPIVGQCLLRSIREVLGVDVATDAVLDAWGAAYQQLADILIAAEEAVYKKNEEAVGGWRNTREFELIRKEQESSEIASFHFAPTDKGVVIAYQPGQYLGVQVHLEGVEVRRNYSLSQLPNGKEYRLSIKREDGGVISNYIHNMAIGDKIFLIPPAGEFVYTKSEKPLVLIGAGIGLTPLLPMLEHALQESNSHITFIHTARNKDVQAFRGFVDNLAASNTERLTVHHHYSQEQGRLDEEKLRALLPVPEADFDAYFVGPKAFMSDVKKALLAHGVPEAQIHFEFFGPAQRI